ncbi:MAG: YdjY domain-containing protein [Bradymonadia bacterium]
MRALTVCRGSMLWVVLFALSSLSACGDNGSTSTQKGKASTATSEKAADAADATIRRRRRRPSIKLATPQPNRPKAGEPQRPEDFGQMAKTVEEGVPAQKPGAPPVERIDKFRFRVGKVEVDREAGTVRIPGRLNMKEGILEYFAVATMGKLHESVLELLAEPSHIHLGLILIDLEPSKYVSDPKEGRKVVKAGSQVKMFIEWLAPDTKKMVQMPAEHWLYNRKLKGSPTARNWVFTGSFFYNGQYAADNDRSVVALVPDGTAIIGNVADDGNPYRGDGLGFEVYRERVPPLGTPVAFVIQSANKGTP